MVDDVQITGALTEDDQAPMCEFVAVELPTTIRIEFNEPIHFYDNEVCIQGIGCAKVERDQMAAYELVFSHPFTPGKEYRLVLPSFTDLYGNKADSKEELITFYYPKAYDVLINEIMADPDPPAPPGPVARLLPDRV